MRPRETRTFSPISIHSTLHTSINESSWFVVGVCLQNRVETLSWLNPLGILFNCLLLFWDFFSPLSSSCLCFLYTMWSQQPIGTDFQLGSVCTTKCFYPLASGHAFFSFELIPFTTHMIPPSCSLKEILHTFTILAVLFNIPECVCFCARLPVS